MADSLANLIGNIQAQAEGLSGLTDTLSLAATTMSGNAHSMMDINTKVQEQGKNVLQQVGMVNTIAKRTRSVVEELAEKSSLVNTQNKVIDEQSVNMMVQMEEMKRSVEGVSLNIDHFATSIEQLSSSVHTIAESTLKANDVSQQASEHSESSKQVIDTLSNTLLKVSKVVDTIKKVASQTNLLALNATIEAASAGEAGKGFAVVAGEVKNLSHQSSNASAEIQQNIEQVQHMGKQSQKAMEQVASIINNLSDVNGIIALNTEEQNKAMSEIASLVKKTSSHAQSMLSISTQSFHLGSDVSHSIRQSIAEMEGVVHQLSDVRQQTQRVLTSVAEAEETVCVMAQGMSQASQAVSDTVAQIDHVQQGIASVKEVTDDLTRLVTHFKV
jgi:methyl-accepting chemotaxis protein